MREVDAGAPTSGSGSTSYPFKPSSSAVPLGLSGERWAYPRLTDQVDVHLPGDRDREDDDDTPVLTRLDRITGGREENNVFTSELPGKHMLLCLLLYDFHLNLLHPKLQVTIYFFHYTTFISTNSIPNYRLRYIFFILQRSFQLILSQITGYHIFFSLYNFHFN